MTRWATKVVNLFGGPGSGKSTLRAALFAELKMRGVLCDEATEYAKDLCWEGNPRIHHQLSVFAEQDWRIQRLMGKVEYIITDSPVLLSIYYGGYAPGTAFNQLVLERHRCRPTFNVFVERVKPYEPAGRFQDEAGARLIDDAVRTLLTQCDVSTASIRGERASVRYLADLLSMDAAASLAGVR